MTKFVPVPHYQPNVRMGNWFEDICLEQEKKESFKNDRASNKLLVDKTRILFNNFHKEIDLEAPSDNIRIGSIIQLIPLKMNICNDEINRIKPALSIVINESVVRSCQYVSDLCEMTIAPATKPIVRNSFRVVNTNDCQQMGDERELLKYGQHFRLECLSTPETLFVYSINKSTNLNHVITTTYDSRKNGEVNLPLGLVYKKNVGIGKDTPIAATNWFCQHIDPKRRFETNMQPIESNTPLVITHAATNRNLAAENIKIQTLFGPEFLVSVTNHKNVFHRENWNNIWKVSNGY